MDIIDVRFNRKNTNRLLKSEEGDKKSLSALNLLLDDDKPIGFSYSNWFIHQNYLIIKIKDNEYHMITSDGKEIYCYDILDLGEFIDYIMPDELYCDDYDQYKEFLKLYKNLQPSGFVEIDEQGLIYLYDYCNESS